MKLRSVLLAGVSIVGVAVAVACGTEEGTSDFPNSDSGLVDVPDFGDGSIGFGDGAITGPCKPRTCTDINADCGPAGDGCGGVIQCGSCTAPDICGGGGKPSQCGGGKPPSCVPKTCQQLGFDCGPAGDGCGGVIQCGSCTAPKICGGGGQGSVCGGGGINGPDGGVCVPLAQCPVNSCGPIADGCGGLLQCGSCNAPQICGGGGIASQCGGVPSCVPLTCQQQNANCGPVADGCGNLLNCGTCSGGNICGGGGVASQCGGAPDGGSCQGLCLQQVTCDSGPGTRLTGTVYAPNGTLPLPNAVVYVPNGPVAAFTPGVTCEQCATASGSPLVTTTSAFDGTFTLDNVPVGNNIPLVIQIGRWRRQITIPNVPACVTTALTAQQTRLPKNKAEGDIPLTAISTGDVDALECVIRKLGVDDAEFTNPNGTGRIRFYQDNGARINNQTPAASTLYGNQTELDKYDIALFACVGSRVNKAAADQNRVIAFANKGGRVYATHFSYVWLYNTAPWNTTAAWAADTASWNTATAVVDTSFPKGLIFSQWLAVPAVGALAANNPPRITVAEPRHDVNDPLGNPANGAAPLGWLRTYNNVPQAALLHYTFNTPYNNTQQCGRVLYSDFHVTTGSASNNVNFPNECSNTAMTPQEKVLAFMLFDLASCVPPPPPPPSCVSKTCQQLGQTCGPAGDGCGNVIQCGVCQNGQTCSGIPSTCKGPSCTPKTCQQLNANCGLVPDGCGGTLNCGTCQNNQNCGGGGNQNQCGNASCTPKTCQQQNVSCGPAADGCGALLDCGPCPPPVCTPQTCQQAGANCGPVADGCGGLLQCGTCAPPQSCGGGGIANQCGGNSGPN